jgi:glycolate oxidase iron-sulfur subunit
MLTEIDPSEHGPLGEPMAEAVRNCVHCGFCLAACPTYGELGQEVDTPRGRIVLMKEVLEGSLDLEAAAPHLDQCLGCLACEPACPSGVRYRDLISPFRALTAAKRKAAPLEKLRRALVSASLPYPGRFRWAARAAKLFSPLAAVAPPAMRPMFTLLPDSLPRRHDLNEVNPAVGERRARVALLAGCAQQVLDPDINAATVDVLTRNGVEVVVPRDQGCCGALSWHVGDHAAAAKFARQNLSAFPHDVDAIVTNTAGCGSGMHEYPLILRGTADEERAAALAKQVCDVSVFLDRLGGLEEIPELATSLKVAYHDACHLSNGQGVRDEPRRLLRRIPGLELLEIRNGHLCCGSAGTYNIDQPEIAASLGRKKAEAVVATGAAVLASGNIGCSTQLRMHLSRLDSGVQVWHTVQILRDAYRSDLA